MRNYTKYYLEDYTISRNGDVINKHTGKVLQLQPNDKGYLRFRANTENGKKNFLVHRLVAERYVPNPENKSQVNHKDGNKLNNNADNLEWVTNLENRRHAINNGLHIHGEQCSWAKLTQSDVDYIRNHNEMSRSELAIMFNVNPGTISDIRNYKSWKITEKIC